MELDERKAKILIAIIQTYQETGEPVGSRTISKYTDLKLSSATIRNEMSDLEDMGLIIQPHTSAGRIPTDKGYRYYVDQLMQGDGRQLSPINSFLIQRVDRLELLLKQMAKILAKSTNYATMITGPNYESTKLKFIQLSRVENKKLLVVIVLDGNLIKNSILDIDTQSMTEQELLSLNLLLNSNLNGLMMNEINLGLISNLQEQAGEYGYVVREVLDALAKAMKNEEDMQIYTSGANNFFKYPELADGEVASELIQSFEEKEQLGSFIRDALVEDSDDNKDIQVYIGNELSVDTMKDCSVVTANYELSDGIKGRIGVIGPKRMDYQKVMDSLR
ncbi:heat-inducible transcription repressor hrcA [Lachnospiraceae bacterium TWA4]|nr:heat-inducible transcription repressor hrcA [Lachnospiraceae bacterium TWA4]